MASIDSISESAPIDIEVSGAQGPRGRDAAATVVTGNFTAANDYQYNVMASAVATDPTGVEGKGYTVFVINGTATVGGVAYPTEGTIIRRYYESGTWRSKVYKDSTAYATAAQGTDERVPTAAGLIAKFGTAKVSLVDGDKVAIFDSASADAPKHTLWSVVKSTLKTYFDTVYAAIVHTHVSAQITDASDEGSPTTKGKVVLFNTDGGLSLVGSASSFATIGEYGGITTSGGYASIGTTGENASIQTLGNSASISTSGNGAIIYTTGESASIYTAGSDASIYTTGGGFIQTSSTFRISDGSYVTTISGTQTEDRAISFPDKDGVVALVEDITNSVTSATTSDGTADLSLASATISGLLTAGHIHGNLAGTLYTHVRTGEAMSKGDPFYISGFHVGSSQPIAMRADANDAAKMPAIGVMDADYAANTSSANGIISGTLSSINTAGYTANSPIFVADGGGYSNNTGRIPQQIGITERANASTGAFIVSNVTTHPYFSDVTIATDGALQISNGSGAAYLRAGLTTDVRDFDLPDESGTILLAEQLTNGSFSANIDSLQVQSSATFEASSVTTFDTGAEVNFLGLTNYENAATFTYGATAATAHRTALGVASTQLQTESLFSLLTLQESGAGVYTANAGTAAASADGDILSLSAATANQRPNVYRFRNWNRNPGVSGTANSVTPVKLASAGNIYHLGSGANGASFRCGFGMVNGASAVAANANATTGRGFGWRIAWNSSTSKLEFNLWAHDGTSYVEGTGIDTELGAGNLDGFFNVIVCLSADGTVTACTWFGSQTSTSSVPSTTPTVTLAGGPTSGTFANLGTPSWIAAAHSTTAPASGNSIIARISNRKLAIG